MDRVWSNRAGYSRPNKKKSPMRKKDIICTEKTKTSKDHQPTTIHGILTSSEPRDPKYYEDNAKSARKSTVGRKLAVTGPN